MGVKQQTKFVSLFVGLPTTVRRFPILDSVSILASLIILILRLMIFVACWSFLGWSFLVLQVYLIRLLEVNSESGSIGLRLDSEISKPNLWTHSLKTLSFVSLKIVYSQPGKDRWWFRERLGVVDVERLARDFSEIRNCKTLLSRKDAFTSKSFMKRRRAKRAAACILDCNRMTLLFRVQRAAGNTYIYALLLRFMVSKLQRWKEVFGESWS